MCRNITNRRYLSKAPSVTALAALFGAMPPQPATPGASPVSSPVKRNGQLPPRSPASPRPERSWRPGQAGVLQVREGFANLGFDASRRFKFFAVLRAVCMHLAAAARRFALALFGFNTLP